MAEKEVKKLNTGGKFIKSQAILSIFELFKKPFIHIILIIILGLLVYSNTFSSPFHLDDEYNIVENYKLRDLSNFWPPTGSRWFGFLTFALNYNFGGLDTVGYHIVNLIIHIINAILIYFLVVLTFKTPYFKVAVVSVSAGNQPTQFNLSTFQPFNYLPLFIALLFVSHPIQTQAVTYIVQRFTSLATMFYLLSLVMYIKFRIHDTRYTIQDKKSKNRESCIMHHASEPKLHATRYTLYAVSLLSAILAMKTKEISFTLPFIIILYEFCFFKSQNYELRTTNLRRLLYLMPFLLTLLIIPLSIVGIDKPIGDAIGELREATQETEEISRWSYLFTQFRVIVTYIRLLFLPVNQNLDYDYPIYNSFLNPNVFLSFLFLLSIFGFGVYLFYRSRYNPPHPPLVKGGMRGFVDSRLRAGQVLLLQDFRPISFGIFWFFTTLSVESSIIPIKDVIFEHRGYLPSVGAAIAFSIAVFYVLQFVVHRSRIFTSYFPLPTSYFLLMSTLVVTLSIATYQRNIVWRDGVTLWEDVVKRSPNKERGHTNLGNVYKDNGWIDKAIEQYQIALRLKPSSGEGYNNLGAAYYHKGWIDKAIEHYQIALRLKPNSGEIHNNLGLAYYAKNWVDKAIEQYQIALRLKPDCAEAHHNLGNVYYSKGLADKAIEHYQNALRLKPNFAKAHYYLGIAYYAIGWLDKAIEHYQIALSLNLRYAAVHYNLGVAYQEKGWVDKAIEQYGAALKLNPNDADTHNNLGAAYENKGLLDEAIKEYQTALRLNPKDEVARNNLNRILHIKNK